MAFDISETLSSVAAEQPDWLAAPTPRSGFVVAIMNGSVPAKLLL
jgi:hypothetical protein